MVVPGLADEGGGEAPKPGPDRAKLGALLGISAIIIVFLFICFGASLAFVVYFGAAILLAGRAYYYLTDKTHAHTRDICFTIWFTMVALLTVSVPFLIGPAQPSNEHTVECIEGWSPSAWFAKGVPCTLTLPAPTQCTASVELDQFLLWEVAAVAQTLVFGILVFWEMKHAQFRRTTVLIVLAIIALPLWALYSMIMHWWYTQLLTTSCFFLAIFFEDWSLWKIEHEIVMEKTKANAADIPMHEREFFARVTWGLDLPLVLATSILVLAVWTPYDGLGHEYAKRFFAGGTACSLILANAGLVLSRVIMHKQHFVDTWSKSNPGSVKAFLGWPQ